MVTRDSANPRPRRTRRTREEVDTTSFPSNSAGAAQSGPSAEEDEGAAEVPLPPQQPDGQPQALDTNMFAQMIQFMVQSQQHQQQQIRELMAQQFAFQQQILS